MIISAQPQTAIVTPVTAMGRTVVGNESLEAKATALPPVEETAATNKNLLRANPQALLSKPDAALNATLAAASSAALTTTVSLSGNVPDKSLSGKTAVDKSVTAKTNTDDFNSEQKSLAAIGRESLAKALDAADIDSAVVSGDASDQPIAAPNDDGESSAISSSQGQSPFAVQSNQEEPSQTEQNRRKQSQIAQTGFTEEEIIIIQKLAARDREVRAHEQAHSAVGGDIAGSPSYTYKRGPDGVLYAVGGEVSISVSEVPNNPQATLRKAEKVQRAALAPAEPSAQDRRVAALAARMAAEARAEIASQISEANQPNTQSSSVGGLSSNAIDGTSRPESVSGSRPLNNSEYSNTGYTRGYVSERANLQDPSDLNEYFIASLNGKDRQGSQIDFRV